MDRDQRDVSDPLSDIPPEVQRIEPASPTPSGASDRRKKKNTKVPLDSSHMYTPPVRHTLCTLRHFTVVLAPETDLLGDWDDYTDKEQRMYCAAVLGKLHDLDYRGLADLLEQKKVFALEAGFDPENTPHYSTLSRHLRDFDNGVLQEIVEAGSNAALHDHLNGYSAFRSLPSNPPKPREYYEIDLVDEKREISMDAKMGQASQLVAKYMALAAPHIGFGRDKSAGNYKYSTQSFYRLLAHTAIEDCFLKNGYEILKWQSDDDVDVPPPPTLRKYAKNMGEVEDIEEQFLQATCALLSRESLGLTDKKVHLAYDLTQVPWYGTDHRWTTRSNKKDNTAEFWHYAIISTVTPGRNYVLGATPIKNRSEVSAALDRMLRNIREHLDLDLGRIYLDRGMYHKKIVKTCRAHGLKYMIQAPDKGRPAELAAEAEKGKPNPDNEVDFAGLRNPVQGFAYPLHEDEVGYEERVSALEQTKITEPGGRKSTPNTTRAADECDTSLEDYMDGVPEPEEDDQDDKQGDQNRDGHTVWITNIDVDKRDLEGLNYQFRNRWKVETAIRQLKHDFQGRCASKSREVRTLQFGSAQLFFNFWVALNHELSYHFGNLDNIRLTGLETLHAIREADFESAKQGSHRLL